MSESELTGATKRLLDAAKGDGPSAATRARVWDGVATTAKIGGAGVVACGTAASAASGMKGAVITAILGGVVTVGLALALLAARSPDAPVGAASARGSRAGASVAGGPTVAPRDDARPSETVAGVAASAAPPAERIECAPVASARSASPSPADRGAGAHVEAAETHARTGVDPAALPASATASPPRVTSKRAATAATGTSDDALMREAILVAEARGALMRGDAGGALVTIQRASHLSSRSLEPEELSLEAQALRALGRADEAAAADAVLRQRFPFHALAR